jgi:hypothetical protein
MESLEKTLDDNGRQWSENFTWTLKKPGRQQKTMERKLYIINQKVEVVY